MPPPPPPPPGRRPGVVQVACAAALLLLAAAAQPAAAQAQYSKAWGMNGELWSPTGRLSDWSYAGGCAGRGGPAAAPRPSHAQGTRSHTCAPAASACPPAGYMAGERAIPNYPVAVKVTDPRFNGGAKGDGRTGARRSGRRQLGRACRGGAGPLLKFQPGVMGVERWQRRHARASCPPHVLLPCLPPCR